MVARKKGKNQIQKEQNRIRYDRTAVKTLKIKGN
jgi:hypothetical protein